MDIYKKKWTSLQESIFSLVAMRAGDRLSQREIAGILGVSATAVGDSVRQLIKEGLLSLEKMKTINLISFNRDDRKAIQLKRVENLRNIYASGLSDFLENELAGATIMLFGSYSRGEDITASDIDIAVIGRKPKALDFTKYQRILQKTITINYYQNWKNIHIHLKNNILNGILLNGTVEL